MRRILTLALIPAASIALVAQATGGVRGKITNKAGKPVPNATARMLRVGTTIVKDLKVKEDGSFFQVGFEPREFELTVEAEGYAPSKQILRIQLGGVTEQNVTLLTTAEVQAANAASNPDAAANKEATDVGNTGAAAYNEAIGLLNAQDFGGALPLLEKAYNSYKVAIEKAKDKETKAAAETSYQTVQRMYGVALFEVGKIDPDKKAEYWTKAEGILLEVYPKTPETNVAAIVPVAKALAGLLEDKDKAAAAQYQAIVDKVEPPNPAQDYNKAVDAVNAGKFADAKAYLEKCLAKNPNYAKAYYLLGIAEYSNSNMKAAKTSFLKCLELEPNGEKASDVKAMLEDPALKKIK